MTQTLVFLALSAFIAMGIYTVMGQTLGEGMGGMVRALYWRLCAFTGLMMMSDYMEWLFAAEQQVGRQAIYHMSFTGLQAAVVITMAASFRDVNAMIWGLTVFSLGRFLFALGYTIRRYRPSPKLISLRTIREQLSFALPVGLFAIVLILVNQTDKFIINRFMGRAAFAIYVVGAFQLPVVNMISMSVRNVIFPLMSQRQSAGDYQAIAAIWKRAVLKMAVLYFPLFVFFESTAPGVIRLLFTDTYIGATPIFMLYLALLPQLTTDSVAIIQVFKDTGYLLRTFGAAFIFNLVLSIGLFEVIGRVGVPLATVITIYLANMVNMVYSSRRCGVEFRSFVPARRLAGRFLVAAIPGVPLWWVSRHYNVDDVFGLGVLAVAYFSIYFGFCRVAGVVTIDDISSMFGRGKGGWS